MERSTDTSSGSGRGGYWPGFVETMASWSLHIKDWLCAIICGFWKVNGEIKTKQAFIYGACVSFRVYYVLNLLTVPFAGQWPHFRRDLMDASETDCGVLLGDVACPCFHQKKIFFTYNEPCRLTLHILWWTMRTWSTVIRGSTPSGKREFPFEQLETAFVTFGSYFFSNLLSKFVKVASSKLKVD